MKTKLFSLALLFFCQIAIGQNTMKVSVTDEANGSMLPGATVQIKNTSLGSVTDSMGMATILDIPNGEFEVVVSFLGFRTRERDFYFPLRNPSQAVIFELEPVSEELTAIKVSTTRSSRSIREIPTRIELISLEELDEKASVRPADIKLLLNESTGIAVQTTSAASGISNIRMQGLDGRYTQILKDGMPLYQGFSNGLSAVQISPLDLNQVEFIKGSASTLYGGGAIAGLVNLISKTPDEQGKLDMLFNATSTKGFDAAGFWSKRGKKYGGTIFTALNRNAAYAPGNSPFTAVPKLRRYEFDPKLFVYLNDKTTIRMGINTLYEDRQGGDIYLFGHGSSSMHRFLEQNKTVRVSSQFQFDHQLDEHTHFQLKNAVSFFDRRIYLPGFFFDALQYATFTEFNFRHETEKMDWTTGMTIQSEDFRIPENAPGKDYSLSNIGLFCQNLARLSNKVTLETGLRLDYYSPYNDDHLHFLFLLPRMNLLVHWNEHLASRIGGGMGYKMPSIFMEEAEEANFQLIQPVNIVQTNAEKSIGSNADLQFHTQLGEVSLSMNQLLFFTHLNEPLILRDSHLVNADGHLQSAGFETNLRLQWKEWHAWVGYSHTEVRRFFDGNNTWQPLTPRHRLNATLAWEESGNFRFVLEGLYVGEQHLNDGRTGKDYAIFGFLAEKMFDNFDLFFAGENLTNVRQDRIDTFFTGTVAQPVFQGIYAPLEGRVINAGIRIKLR